jgi:hypothetical protein
MARIVALMSSYFTGHSIGHIEPHNLGRKCGPQWATIGACAEARKREPSKASKRGPDRPKIKGSAEKAGENRPRLP